MKKIKKSLVKVAAKASAMLSILTFFAFGMNKNVSAQASRPVLPEYIRNIRDAVSGNPTSYINNRVGVGLTALFTGVFLVAVGYSGMAAVKFMSSQGDSGKLEESKGAVKAILMGFAAMIVSIVGVFVILYLMGAGRATPDTEFNFEVT